MAEETIDRLQIEIEAKASASTGGIDKLAESIQRLKSAVGGGTDKLSGIAASIDRLKTALYGIKGTSGSVSSLAKSLEKLQALKLDGIGSRLSELSEAAKSLGTIGSSMQSIRDFGKGVTSMQKSFAKLNEINMGGVADRIKEIVDAIKPLTDEMIRAGAGVSNFGTQMKDLAAAVKTAETVSKRVQNVTKTSRGGFAGLKDVINLAKVGASIYAVQRLTDVIGKAVTNTNSYIEDMNLFAVAMGRFAQEGEAFAQKMQDVLGVNAGEAMRNMGLFQQLTTSFGVASDQASVLSRNFTQLGYDLSSFFNLPIEDAFEKLQSGLAAEIEPLRRIGIDLSVARLQQELYNLGINESVNNLSQADKALLRYIATIHQTTNAQGDMARTIMTPANALRVLQAQFELASRAIGSIFIPALTAILPYAIAVTKVIGQAAAAVAAFFGFEMPQIDYSTINDAGFSVGDLAGNMGDLADKTAEAKKQMNYLIGGFDELNIMQKKAGVSGGLAGAELGGNILGDIALPSYDMFGKGVESQVNQIVDKINAGLKKIKDAFDKIKAILKPFTPLLKGIASAFAAAFAFKWLGSLLSKIKKLAVVTKTLALITGGIAALKTALSAAAIVFGLTRNPLLAIAAGFESLWLSFKGFMQSLSPMQKFIVTLVALTAEFVTVYDAVKKFNEGNLTLGQTLANIVPVVALVGTTLYAMLGPWGLVLTAVTGVVAAFKAANDVQSEIRNTWIDENFYSNIGVSINDLAEAFDNSTSSIKRNNEKLQDTRSQIDQNNTSINNASDVIRYLSEISEKTANGISLVDVPKIKTAFDDLYNGIKRNTDLIVESLTMALISTPDEIIDTLKADIPELVSIISGAGKKMNEETEILNEEFQKLYSQWEKNPSDTALFSEMTTVATKLMGFSGTSVQAVDDFKESLSSIKDVSFPTPQAAIDAINAIGQSAVDAKSALEQSKTEILKQIEQLSIGLDNTQKQKLQSFFIDSFSIQQNDIDKSLSETFSIIKKSYGDKIDSFYKDAELGWTEKIGALWDKITGVNQAETISELYANKSRQLVEERVGKPVLEQMEAVIKSVDEQNARLSNAMSNYGHDAIDGFSSGIKNNLNISDAAMKEIATSSIKSFHDSDLDYGSPSKKMEQFGVWAIEGLAQGLSDQTALAEVNTAITTLTNSIMTAMQTAFSSLDTMSAGLDTGLVATSGQGGSMFYQFGYQFMTDLSNGIAAGTPLVQAALTATSTTISTDFMTLFQIGDEASAVFAGYGLNFMTGLSNGIKDNVPLVTDELTALGETIDEQYRGYMDGFQEIIIVDLKKLTEIYGNTMDVMKNTTVTTIGTMMSQLNRLITRIDTAIKKLERLQDMGGSLGGKRSGGSGYSSDSSSSGGYSASAFSLDAPSPYGAIPALADGGVVYDEAVSRIAGYQSARAEREAATPQNTMRETVEEAMIPMIVALAEKLDQVIEAINENSDRPIELDGEPIATNVVNRINAITRRSGVSPLRKG